MTTAEPHADQPHQPRIGLEVWADVVCPWCYIGKRRLEHAIAAFEHPAEVAVVYRSFELDPATPVGGEVSVLSYLGERYGGLDAARQMTERVTRVASADEVLLAMDMAVRANSFDAHRMAHLGQAQGGLALQAAVLERLFAAHFAEGKAIDDIEVLQRVGAEAGLDERRLAWVLATDDFTDDVRADEARARELGIRGVPYVAAAGSVAVGGAQPVATFVELLRVAWAETG